jgi:hypothetical protein
MLDAKKIYNYDQNFRTQIMNKNESSSVQQMCTLLTVLNIKNFRNNYEK